MVRLSETRLLKLEQTIAPPLAFDNAAYLREQTAQAVEKASAWLAGWFLLRSSMAPEHIERVEAVIPRTWTLFVFECSVCPPSLHWRIPHDVEPLVQHVDRRIMRALHGTHAGPFVLPPVVAEVVTGSDARDFNWDCPACGYEVPAERFSTCPACGVGTVACLAWYKANNFAEWHGPTFEIPQESIDELRPQVAAVAAEYETAWAEYMVGPAPCGRAEYDAWRERVNR